MGDPVKNIEICIRRTHADTWKLLKEIKSPVAANTCIDINARATEIRVIQKTVSLRREADDIITAFRVYATPIR